MPKDGHGEYGDGDGDGFRANDAVMALFGTTMMVWLNDSDGDCGNGGWM